MVGDKLIAQQPSRVLSRRREGSENGVRLETQPEPSLRGDLVPSARDTAPPCW